jgi:hypothetical protein
MCLYERAVSWSRAGAELYWRLLGQLIQRHRALRDTKDTNNVSAQLWDCCEKAAFRLRFSWIGNDSGVQLDKY